MYLKSLPKPVWPYVLNVDSDQAEGLVNWWPGDPSGNEMFDLSGRANNLLFNNGAKLSYGQDRGQSLSVASASSQFAESSVVSVVGMPLTLCGWVNPATLGNNRQMMGIYTAGQNAGRFTIIINLSGNIQTVQVDNSVASSSASGGAITAGIWWHILAIWRSTTSREAWINGVQVGTDATSLGATSGMNRTSLGRGRSDTPNYTNGLLEDCRVYNRALNPAEIWDIFEPQTRWELRYQPGKSRYFVGGAVTGVTFDSAANSGYQAASGNYTFNRTVAANSNRHLIIAVEILSVPGTTVTSVTDDDGGTNVAATLIGVQNVVAGTGRVEFWQVIAPVTGTKTIRVILSASVASAAGAVSRYNVHQTSPVEGFNGASGINAGVANQPTCTCTTISDNCVIAAAVATSATTVTAGSGKTIRNNVTGTLGSGVDEDTGATPITPPGSTAMAFGGLGITDAWAEVVVAIRSVADAALFQPWTPWPQLAPILAQ